MKTYHLGEEMSITSTNPFVTNYYGSQSADDIEYNRAQSRSQSPRPFWSAARHGALETSSGIIKVQYFRTSGFTAHAWIGLYGV